MIIIQCYRTKCPFSAMLGPLASMISDFKNPIFNPEYGTRIFRRRIRIEKHDRRIVAGLEDTLHAFKLVVQHEGDVVTAIEGTWVRYPNGTCPGAVGQFAPYIGKTLTAQRTAFRSYSDISFLVLSFLYFTFFSYRIDYFFIKYGGSVLHGSGVFPHLGVII